jgi:hypothetical protein
MDDGKTATTKRSYFFHACFYKQAQKKCACITCEMQA